MNAVISWRYCMRVWFFSVQTVFSIPSYGTHQDNKHPIIRILALLIVAGLFFFFVNLDTWSSGCHVAFFFLLFFGHFWCEHDV